MTAGYLPVSGRTKNASTLPSGVSTLTELDFVAIEREEYDLVLRADFAAGVAGQALLDTIRSADFRGTVEALGGYDLSRAGAVKPLTAPRSSRRRQLPP